MTAEFWLNSNNLGELLGHLYSERGLSDRKLQMLCCAFCLRQSRHISAVGVRHLLTQMESFADRELARDELRTTRRHVRSHSDVGQYGYERENLSSVVHYAIVQLAAWFMVDPESPYQWEYEDDLPVDWYEQQRMPYPIWTAQIISEAIDSDVEITEGWSFERDQQLLFLRDIFGNPFRSVEIDPRWRTSNVVDLSQAIYQEQAFERMPILADALMDAGCDSEEMLNHCRGDGPHARGCWVVDLLLGKE